MPSDYAKTLGARLRAIRTQQGLSLHGVEEKSRGRWKAVVVGSYERGDRSVTVQKLAELAEFYGVPVSELLPGDVAARRCWRPSPKLVIDLERMAQLPKDKAGPLARYVATIQSQRGDYNGRVLSIRQEDLRSLAVIYDKTPDRPHRGTDQLGNPRLRRPRRHRHVLSWPPRLPARPLTCGLISTAAAGPLTPAVSRRQAAADRLADAERAPRPATRNVSASRSRSSASCAGHRPRQPGLGGGPLARARGKERGPFGQRGLDPRQQFPDALRPPAPRRRARLDPTATIAAAARSAAR